MRASPVVAVALVALAPGCGGVGQAGAPSTPSASEGTAAVAAQLDRLARGATAGHEATFRSILEDTLAKDPYACLPSPARVFSGEGLEGERRIEGVMPHYGFFFGPMSYTVGRRDGLFRVSVRVAVELPPEGGTVELPDCELARELGATEAVCKGTPYAASGSLSACPGSGTFSLPATRKVMLALLRRWSREAARYWDRDAVFFGLPVRYDFVFAPAEEIDPGRADLRLPLSLTCGRTPYFSAFRSGWSLPIVAHEVGHALGLLDEYETFSGLVPSYPKTPFPGAEVSRMGLSMREETRVLPLHHYLVLRRAFCPEPRRGFFEGWP